MKKEGFPKVLLVHPWIHDFAAYDFWVKPLGLLRIGGWLRRCGFQVELIDCLDPEHPVVVGMGIKRRTFGQGKFFREAIPKPRCLEGVPRRFCRYGLPPEVIMERLKRISRPDVVLVTSGMTYWYRGVQETIALLRRVFPDVPVVLGGIYATLCPDHARMYSGADLVIPGGDLSTVARALSSVLPVTPHAEEDEGLPAWDLLPQSRAVVVKTSEGCPFNCRYCASRVLFPGFKMRSADRVVHELVWALASTEATDVAFYDDALLVDSTSHLREIFEGMESKGVHARYHCPNGLHAAMVTEEVARLLFRSQVVTLRLGLESSSPSFHRRMGDKVSREEFLKAVECLRRAGFTRRQIGVYVMVGLPGQRIGEVEETLRFVLEAGAWPYLAEYSPVPGTSLWEEAVRSSPFPLEEEPLFHNNTLMPCRWEGFTPEDLARLKVRLQRLRAERGLHGAHGDG
jgi:pyruvate-formate lyase-activating enzyme